MKKLDFTALIKESVGELRKRERSEKEARIRWRVQLLRLLKNQETDSIKAACQICGITPKHGYDLWKKYREQGLAKYLQLGWKPRRSKLSGEQQAQLLERAATENGFGSQAEALAYLQSQFAVSYTQGGVCLLFQRLKSKPRSRVRVIGKRRRKSKWNIKKLCPASDRRSVLFPGRNALRDAHRVREKMDGVWISPDG